MRTPLAAAAAALLLLLAGCGGEDGTADVAAGDLLASAADEMAGLTTVRLQVSAEADVADLPVRGVDAQVTREGEAAGTAEIEQAGQLLEVRFVVVADAFHYQLLGSWQELSRAEGAGIYDPSAVLDPDRGVANLIRTAGATGVDGTAEVSGVDTYRVAASFDPAAAAALVPGLPEGVTGTLWIGTDRPLLHRARFALPDGGGTVTAELSEFDEPADIHAP